MFKRIRTSKSPDSKKDISLDEGGIVQAEPTGIRRNLTKVLEGDDDSSGDDWAIPFFICTSRIEGPGFLREGKGL